MHNQITFQERNKIYKIKNDNCLKSYEAKPDY